MIIIDPRSRRFIQYALIGGAGTLLHYAILLLMVSVAGADAIFATTLGACAGAVVNFYLNARFNFKTDRSWGAAMRFFVVAGLGVALNSITMLVLTSASAMNYVISQLVCTAVVLIFTFMLNSVWTFRRS